MRQIGTLPNESDARRLADYLLTQKIATQLLPEPPGWAVWVCDEDRLAQARQEFAEFTRNPADPRYQTAAQTAQAIRKEEEQAEKKYRRNLIDVRARWGYSSSPWTWPVTFGLIVASVVVAVLSGFGRGDSPVTQWLSITHYWEGDGKVAWYPGLSEIRDGQVWRIFTPMFLHFSILHILFNMWALYDFGRQIEFRRGSWRLGLLVLVTAAASNLAQYGADHPAFGGMSGVVFGLFGYIWMKARFDPDAGLYMHPNTVVFVLFWGVLCTTGYVGPIANYAHGAGLAAGVMVGLASAGWNEHKRRDKETSE